MGPLDASLARRAPLCMSRAPSGGRYSSRGALHAAVAAAEWIRIVVTFPVPCNFQAYSPTEGTRRVPQRLPAMGITPVLLIVLDGFGYREECDDNAICQARKPHWNFLWATCPHTTIDASEKWVGLPTSQMGNSEVGHMNIGAGRVVYQDYTKIELAIETGEFRENPVLRKAVEVGAKSALHVLGLVWPGGVHSHESQIHAMVAMAAEAGVKNLYVHAFLDGRDTPPRSAEPSLAALERVYGGLGAGRTVSICGRYF